MTRVDVERMDECRTCGNTNPDELVIDTTIGEHPLVMCKRFCMFDPGVPERLRARALASLTEATR